MSPRPRASAAAPLIHQGTAIGVVGLDSPLFTAASAPNAIDTARLEALAAQAAAGPQGGEVQHLDDQCGLVVEDVLDPVEVEPLVEELAAAAQSLQGQSGRLSSSMGSFRVTA